MKPSFKFKTYDPQIGNYSVVVSPSPMESKEEQALWHLNSAREHDGLPPRQCLPKGSTFAPTE